MSGLIADARTLVEHARVETQNHRFSYGEPMTVESTTQALSDLALRFVSLLIAGSDENGPSLYYTDPSGTFWQCNAKAIEQNNKDLTLQEAETIALSILKQVMEEKVTPNNVDIARVAPTYHLYTPSEVEAVINRPMSIRRKSSLKILPWLQRTQAQVLTRGCTTSLVELKGRVKIEQDLLHQLIEETLLEAINDSDDDDHHIMNNM
ncbi:proteasome subunit alpha type-5-B [Citrus sinensis]|nr:proteasome subunit alpha type-5-B [Citrus sinensis]